MATIKRLFESDTDRYAFDFKLCSTSKGYAQLDTSQDAWYFGTWVNPERLRIVSYTEGDITVWTGDDTAEFIAEIRKTAVWNLENGYGEIHIDPGFNPDIKRRLSVMGLADLMHSVEVH